MRLGIHASNTRNAGGQFQFLITVLDALFHDRGGEEFFAFYFDDGENLAEKYIGEGWHWIALPPADGSFLGPRAGPLVMSWLGKFLRPFQVRLAPVSPRRRGARAIQQSGGIKSFLDPYKLDLMLFPIWTDRCWQWGVPFLFFVHDLQHRLQPEFPEVSIWGQWAWREDLFTGAMREARIAVVDSEEGKRNAAELYNVGAGRLRVLPYAVPPTLTSRPDESGKAAPNTALPRGLPTRFFVYPAKFWPHKNHYRVVEAIGMLKKKSGLEVHVAFAGGGDDSWDVAEYCRALAVSYGVSSQVHFVGHVADDTLAALYRSAVGLVMPTFFGPTNIPYLEAFYFGCPVIASDLPGIREQVGDAALLVDPRSTEAISEAMRRLWNDDALRLRLRANGERRLQELKSRKFSASLRSLIAEALR